MVTLFPLSWECFLPPVSLLCSCWLLGGLGAWLGGRHRVDDKQSIQVINPDLGTRLVYLSLNPGLVLEWGAIAFSVALPIGGQTRDSELQ